VNFSLNLEKKGKAERKEGRKEGRKGKKDKGKKKKRTFTIAFLSANR